MLQDTRRCPFVALFRGAGVGGFAREHVLVSRSTAGLRGLLQEQGVAFGMPLLARRKAALDAAEALDDLRHAAKIGRVRALLEYMPRPRQMLRGAVYTP